MAVVKQWRNMMPRRCVSMYTNTYLHAAAVLLGERMLSKLGKDRSAHMKCRSTRVGVNKLRGD